MNVSYRLITMFTIPWAVMAILNALMNLSVRPAAGSSGEAAESFINTIANPSQVAVDQPTIGTGGAGLGGLWSAANLAIDWLVFLANAAALNHSFFEGQLVMVRYLLLAMTAPLLFVLAAGFAGIMTNMIGGVFGRVAR